jgi:hypothetical protein
MAKRVSLFKLLRRELGPGIAAEGFTEVPQEKSEQTHILLFFREPSNGKSLGFWFQRNVKAYDVDVLGSSFNLEFFRSIANPYDLDTRERAYFLLTPPEREEMRTLQNDMIKRLPPLESGFKPLTTLGGERLEAARQVITTPFNPLHDVWMRYRDEEDVVAWTGFIGRILGSLIDRFDRAKPQCS